MNNTIKLQGLFMMALLMTMMSCKKQDGVPRVTDTALTKFSNVLILGNSITYAGANPSIGWNGNWGMAASSEDADYVHLLKKHFQVRDTAVRVQVKNIMPFEIDPEHYDIDADLRAYRDTKPDLVIIRIGENVSSKIDLNMFGRRYVALEDYFRANNPNVIILGGGSIWGSVADNVMADHPPCALLKTIVNDVSNFSYGKFVDLGVQAHPSDKGMSNIAELLWAKIVTLRPVAH